MEGPGVFLIREKLSFLKGKKIIAVGGNTKQNKTLLIGKTVKDVKSIGKRLIFEFDDVYLIIHFLMYGSYSINERIEHKKERLSLKFENYELDFYNCSVKIVKALNLDETVDVMSEKFDVFKAKEKIKSYDGLITDILLDQSVFAGVGNIIKNEALFRAKVHPLKLAKDLSEEEIDKLIDETLKFSRIFYECRKRGIMLKRELKIYGKKICSECGEEIIVKKLGESNRRTYYCNNCQKL
ncbi:MAG: DNA-formamidopyrimidine glycosylase family protein [Candidatus Woesearchaeota archaeon]